MKMVMLIILFTMIIVTAMSFIPEDKNALVNSDNTQLKTVAGNEKFYEKIGVTNNTNQNAQSSQSSQNSQNVEEKKVIKEEIKIEIVKEEQKDEPKTNIIPENQLITEIIDWKLIGQQKNILITSFKIKNGFQDSIKNQKKLIICKTFNKDNKELNEVKTVLELNIKGREELILKDITIGYVDIDTENINCSISEAPEEKIIDTTIKPLKELRNEKQPNYEQKEKSTGGFIYEKEQKTKEDDDFVLPKLD